MIAYRQVHAYCLSSARSGKPLKGFKPRIETIRLEIRKYVPAFVWRTDWRRARRACQGGGPGEGHFQVTVEIRAAWNKVGHGEKGLDVEQFKRKRETRLGD